MTIVAANPIKVMRGFSLIEMLIVMAIIGLIVTVGLCAWKDGKHQNTMLNPDDWICTKYETRTQPKMIGKIITLITIKVCVEYRRINS